MSTETAGLLYAYNPATGHALGTVPATPIEDIPLVVERARAAQSAWAEVPLRERLRRLRGWYQLLARDADTWADLIRDEVGKPRGEAMGGDVVASLDAIRWTLRRTPRVLADRRIGTGWQRWLLLPSGRLRWRPWGIIGMIGTWNYPLLLNAPPIAQALATGNGVVWKPSELSPMCGERLQQSLDAAGFPQGLVAAVQGGADVGRALTEAAIDKGMFTGGVANGRRVLAGLAARGVPALAELSGFDPAIVLPDAPFDGTVRCLTWGAFFGCGQTCVAVKRVLVVGDPAPWAEALAGAADALRVGDPGSEPVDIGPLISSQARTRFDQTIRAAVDAGGRLLAGGFALDRPGWFYRPTVIAADGPEPEAALEGVFGPVVVVRGLTDPDAAIAAANSSSFALSASVWGRDRTVARRVARRIDAGMVAINDAVAPTAHAAVPFGGTKASGFGRTKGAWGLFEFVQTQTLYERGPGGFRPWLFPYSSLLERLMTIYRRLFHRTQ
ncbi:MAG: aldehyde dehydrogenase family protein [Isosphaeraceae bacterium]|nr:aldehyde dehydrogenase family protein [Isosphaeraceae bacterium]